MYKCKFFSIQELVYPELFAQYKDRQDSLWLALDQRALVTLDKLRDFYGPIIVNDWHKGGQFKLSGLRPLNSGIGASLSQHIFGRAFDCKFRDITASTVRKDIYEMSNTEFLTSRFAYITCIEDMPNMSWFHFDVRNNIDKLRIVSG